MSDNVMLDREIPLATDFVTLENMADFLGYAYYLDLFEFFEKTIDSSQLSD